MKEKKQQVVQHQFYFFVFFFLVIFISCKKEPLPPPSPPITPTLIDPLKYLATLTFDGTDNFDGGEACFPQAFLFNTSQDANNSGVTDAEDNLENSIRFAIGDSIYGTGRTGLSSRGPNNQRPAVYFHFVSDSFYNIYQYWLYYPDNDWLNDHEHDWEKYFVYEKHGDTTASYIKLSSHQWFNTYPWQNISKDDGHPLLGVDGGSHAMKINTEDGIKIRYSGSISKNNGQLIAGDGQTIPWIIFSDDANVTGAVLYPQSSDTLYYGDPYYLTNGNEYGQPEQAPWKRSEWTVPPVP